MPLVVVVVHALAASAPPSGLLGLSPPPHAPAASGARTRTLSGNASCNRYITISSGYSNENW